MYKQFMNNEQYKVKLNKTRRGWVAKGMILGTLAIGGFVASTTQAHADEWVANTPEQIAQRIAQHNAAGDQKITFEKGDTIWNLGLALNLKDPMQLLYQNGLKDGDQYTLKEGITISWNGNYVEIANEKNEVIGGGYVAPEAKIDPQQPVARQASDEVKSNPQVVQPKVTPTAKTTAATPTTTTTNATTTNKTTVPTPTVDTPATQDQANQLQNEVDQTKQTIDNLQNQVNDLKNQPNTDSEEIKQVKEELAAKKAELENAEIAIKKVNEEFYFLSKQLNKVTVTVESLTAKLQDSAARPDSEYAKNLQQQLDTAIAERDDLITKVEAKQAEMDSYKHDELVANLTALQNRLAQLQSIDNTSAKIAELENAIVQQKSHLAETLSNLVVAKMNILKAQFGEKLKADLANVTDTEVAKQITEQNHQQLIDALNQVLTASANEFNSPEYGLGDLSKASENALNTAHAQLVQELNAKYEAYLQQLEDHKNSNEQNTPEQPAEQPVETEKPTTPAEPEQPAETEKPVEQPAETEKPVEQPAETEQPAEQPTTPVDTTQDEQAVKLAEAKASAESTLKQLHLTNAQLTNYLAALGESQSLTEVSNIVEQAKQTSQQNDAAEQAAQAEKDRLAKLAEAKATAKDDLSQLNLTDQQVATFTNDIENATTIEDVNAVSTQAQEAHQVNEANAQAEKDRLTKLAEAKRTANETLRTLTYLTETELNGFISEVNETQSIEAINQLLANATGLNNANKIKNEAAASLNAAKRQALSTISNLQHLDAQSKNQFVQQVQKALNVDAIAQTVADATAKDHQLALEAEEAAKLAEAKSSATTQLQNLNLKDQLNAYTARITNAKTTDEIVTIVNEAKATSATNDETDKAAKELADAKASALETLKSFTHIDTTTYASRVNEATNVSDIQPIVNEAKAAETKATTPETPKPVASNSILASAENKHAFIVEFTKLLNDFRKENGLNELQSTTLLNRAADIRSEDEKEGLITFNNTGETPDSWDHRRPNGMGAGSAIMQAATEGYNLSSSGVNKSVLTHNWVNENIAINYQTKRDTPEKVAQKVFTQWKNSPGHRRNMLDFEAEVFGIGFWGDPAQAGKYIEFTFIGGKMLPGFTKGDIQLFQ